MLTVDNDRRGVLTSAGLIAVSGLAGCTVNVGSSGENTSPPVQAGAEGTTATTVATDSETPTGTRTRAETKTDTDTETSTETETETESETETDTDTATGTEADTPTETETETQTEEGKTQRYEVTETLENELNVVAVGSARGFYEIRVDGRFAYKKDVDPPDDPSDPVRPDEIRGDDNDALSGSLAGGNDQYNFRR